MKWPAFTLLCLLSCAVAAKDPQTLFMMECQGCHLSDGSGGVSSIPSFNNHVAKFLTVPGGREFLAQVPGVARAPLSDEDMALVLNWLLLEFGPRHIAEQYPPYTADEVARLRKIPLMAVTQRRSVLVKKIERSENKKY